MADGRTATRLARFLLALLLSVTYRAAWAETVVLAAANTQPTAFLVDGKPTGVLVELVSEAFRRAGHSVTIKLMPWARCLEEARTGQVDGIFSSFKLAERERFLAFPKEALSAQEIVFFARKDSKVKFDGSFGALRDARIGVILGTSYGKKFDATIDAGSWRSIDQTNSIESNLRKLTLGRIDLMPSFRDVAVAEAKRLGVFAQIRELSPAIETVPTYLAFTRVRDLGELAEAFDKSIIAMRHDGSYDRIVDSYRRN